MRELEKELEEIIEKANGYPEVYVEMEGKELKVVNSSENSLFPSIVKRALKR